MLLLSTAGLIFAAYINKKIGLSLCLLSIILIFIPVKNKDFQLIFFDTGNADMALFRFDKNDYMLIDASEYDNNSKNFSKNLLLYLRQERVKALSKVILTHPDSDHYGGIFKLSEKVQIDTLIVSKQFMETEIGKKIRNHKPLKNTHFFVLQDTLTYRNNDYTIKFLHPDGNYVHANDNNSSIVCLVNHKGLMVLFTGDIEKPAEDYILSKNIQADILKVAHHGSNTGTSEEFLRKVNPELCVISASGNIRRGFPNQRVLDRIGNFAGKTYITGTDGAVIVRMDK
jgi:competence protein ComEC